MSSARDGLARSVQVRLARHAKTIGVDPNLILTRYAVERFLYRLSRSQHADRFVLKGALLLLVWFGDTLRPTRDADLLGFGDLSDVALTKIFTDVCKVDVEQDAMTYLPDTVSIEPIRFEDAYGGHRVNLQAQLGAARLRIQVDVGIGDVVTPAPTWLEYPSLLDLPRPRLRAYTRETVIAEKLHAMVILGTRNSRMKDYFDLHTLARASALDSATLGEAIAATFQRRKTALPLDVPVGLSDEFGRDPTKQAQWKAFVGKNRLNVPALDEVVAEIRRFVAAPLQSARQKAEKA
ncbi:MAG: nucleotidyl transferase AbiEii/AbiGii toxin family protein [Gammaproteobacteria bacterium]|nr:nucleotidyl transferase AbiEii/AbiGii toxin family protein [Gammaproteobacteria bacterium]